SHLIATVRRHFFSLHFTPTTVSYTLSLHDALPISSSGRAPLSGEAGSAMASWVSRSRSAAQVSSTADPTLAAVIDPAEMGASGRSEEHTSELQSQSNLVCRLLLEKKKKTIQNPRA